VHVLNVVEECMSRKQGGAHRAVAQAWKEFEERGIQWACVQACVLMSVWWYMTIVILLDTLKATISYFIFEGLMQLTLDMLGGYIDF
jgi:hypothetical protein